MTMTEVAKWFDAARGILQALVLSATVYVGSTTVDTRTQVQLLAERFGKIGELEERVKDLGKKIDLQTVSGAAVSARLDVLEAKASDHARRQDEQREGLTDLKADLRLLEQRLLQLGAAAAPPRAGPAR